MSVFIAKFWRDVCFYNAMIPRIRFRTYSWRGAHRRLSSSSLLWAIRLLDLQTSPLILLIPSKSLQWWTFFFSNIHLHGSGRISGYFLRVPHCPRTPLHRFSSHRSCQVFDPEWHPISMTSSSRVIQAPSGGDMSAQPRAENINNCVSVHAFISSHDICLDYVVSWPACWFLKYFITSVSHDWELLKHVPYWCLLWNKMRKFDPCDASWLISISTRCPTVLSTDWYRTPPLISSSLPDTWSVIVPNTCEARVLKSSAVMFMLWPGSTDTLKRAPVLQARLISWLEMAVTG